MATKDTLVAAVPNRVLELSPEGGASAWWRVFRVCGADGARGTGHASGGVGVLGLCRSCAIELDLVAECRFAAGGPIFFHCRCNPCWKLGNTGPVTGICARIWVCRHCVTPSAPKKPVQAPVLIGLRNEHYIKRGAVADECKHNA